MTHRPKNGAASEYMDLRLGGMTIGEDETLTHLRGRQMALDLEAAARKQGIKYFLISYTDLFGAQRAKLVPAAAIAGMAKNGCRSVPPASRSRTLTSGSSDKREASAQPEDPPPATM